MNWLLWKEKAIVQDRYKSDVCITLSVDVITLLGR